MKLKPGVCITGVRPEIAFVMPIIDRTMESFGVETVVTSCTDGQHSSTSLHYAGAAVDLRTRDLPDDVVGEVASVLRDALGEDFDVVEEASHVHVEWQPRRRS